MNLKLIGKTALKILGVALPVVITFVDAKNNDIQTKEMKEDIVKEVMETLKNQAKES